MRGEGQLSWQWLKGNSEYFSHTHLTSPSIVLISNKAYRPNQYRPKVGLRNKEYVLARRLRTIVREDSMGTERGSSFIGGKNDLSDWNNVQRTASVERTTH